MLACPHSRRPQPQPLLEPVVQIDGAFLQAGHELAPGIEFAGGFNSSASAAVAAVLVLIWVRACLPGLVQLPAARVGILPALIIRLPAMILCVYVKSPRSGGP